MDGSRKPAWSVPRAVGYEREESRVGRRRNNRSAQRCLVVIGVPLSVVWAVFSFSYLSAAEAIALAFLPALGLGISALPAYPSRPGAGGWTRRSPRESSRPLGAITGHAATSRDIFGRAMDAGRGRRWSPRRAVLSPRPSRLQGIDGPPWGDRAAGPHSGGAEGILIPFPPRPHAATASSEADPPGGFGPRKPLRSGGI